MKSGLDWSQPLTLGKADPYLAWADVTDCASFRLPATAADDMWWLVLVELSDPQGATANGFSAAGTESTQTQLAATFSSE